MSGKLPYRCEYATSGKSVCKKCESFIPKDSLRLGKKTLSPRFDGRITKWYHLKCFFNYGQYYASYEIRQFENIENIK